MTAEARVGSCCSLSAVRSGWSRILQGAGVSYPGIDRTPSALQTWAALSSDLGGVVQPEALAVALELVRDARSEFALGSLLQLARTFP